MKNRLLVAGSILAFAAAGLAGCGSSNGSVPAAILTPGTTSSTTTATTDGATLYGTNCANCHGPLATSEKLGASAARIQTAIAGKTGGMGTLSALTAAQIDAIATVLGGTTQTTTITDGATLYASNCAGCHGTLASSAKAGATSNRIQSAISGNTGGMGGLSALTPAQISAIATALGSATTPPATTVTDGPTLYASNCAGCHGALATSAKGGATSARIQAAITGNTGGMGALTTLSATQVSAIASALAGVTPPVVTDGPTLYANNCAGCHGVLTSTTKGGATTARIQTAIAGNTGGMGALSALTTTQISAIATTLAPIAPTAQACGSCHAIPPATGHHAKHSSKNIACATCHGTGYSTSTVNESTHNNGVKNLASNIGWTAATRSCSNSCHGKKTW